MRSMRKLPAAMLGILAAVGVTTQATAQYVYFTLVPSEPKIVVGETVRVEVWAEMQEPAYAFGAAKIDINNKQNGLNGTITGIVFNPSLAGGGLAMPNANNDLETFTPFQVHFPPVFNANTSNPIMVCSFDWTANHLGKVKYDIDVLDDLGIPNRVVVMGCEPFSNRFGVESQGTWNVIPGPSCLALFGLGGLVATRRRRGDDATCSAVRR